MLQLEGLNPELFRKVLHSLWSTCSRRGILPRGYIISEGLSTLGDIPLASGGYANIWVGELTRNSGLKKVCIKRMKVPTRNGPENVVKVEKVSHFTLPGLLLRLTYSRLGTRRSLCG